VRGSKQKRGKGHKIDGKVVYSWRLRVFVGRRPGGTPEYYMETYHSTASDADARLRDLCAMHGRNALAKSHGLTVDGLIERFIEMKRESGLASGTLRDYESLNMNHFNHAEYGIGHLDASKVGAADIDTLYSKMGRSREITRKAHVVLNEAYEWGRIRRYVGGFNPTKDVETPKPKRGKKRSATLDEIEAILGACAGTDDEDFGDLVYLDVVTGARTEEIAGFQWGDINWEGRFINARRAIDRDNNIVATKTHRSERPLPLDEAAIQRLAALRARCEERADLIGATITDQSWLFSPRPEMTQHYRCDAIDKRLTRVAKAAGVKVSMGMFRHFYGTHVTRNSAKGDVRTPMDLMGHTQVSTLVRYAEGVSEAQREAAEAVGAMLKGR
jgi:integrase